MPHQAYVAEQCQRANLTPEGFGGCIHARVDAGEITETEAPLLVRSLLSAVSITTVNGIAAAIHCLARFPTNGRGCATIRPWPQRLRGSDPLRKPGANVLRTTTKDVEISGMHIGEGVKVLMFLAAANRDRAMGQSRYL